MDTYRYTLALFSDMLRYGYALESARMQRSFSDGCMLRSYRTAQGPCPYYRIDTTLLHERFALFRQLTHELCACTACVRASDARSAMHVAGYGVINPVVFVISQLPYPRDADTDAFAPDFSEAAFLLQWLSAIQISFEENAYYTSLVICPGAEHPRPEEVQRCKYFLDTQLALLQPAIIFALGAEVTQALCNTHEPLSYLRHTQMHYQGIPLFTSHTPQEVLADTTLKRAVWDDLKAMRSYIHALLASASG